MIKYILFFSLFFLFWITVFSQELELCGEVRYNQIHTFDFGHTFKAEFLMKFNTTCAYAEQINIKPTKQSKFEYNGEQGKEKIIVSERKVDEKMFYYNSKEGFFFLNYMDNTPLLVKEDDFNWHWEIMDETKNIGEFVCQKATTSFRGNNYVAWFTSEIPVSYGPWKFNGLPGLILEVMSENKVFYFAATNVKIGENSDCKIEVDTLQFKKAMNIENYVLKRIEIGRRVFARLSSLQPKGSDPITIDEDCEDCIMFEKFKK